MRTLFSLLLFCCLLAAGVAHADPVTVDLADIVGGGDGSGTGADAGVDVTDGSPTSEHEGLIGAPTNSFVPADHPLIDGVVIPDGGSGATALVPVSSTGLTVTGISDSTELSAHTWDHVWNGPNFGTSTGWVGPLLGVHANKGITYDLQAIGTAHGGLVADFFHATPTTGSSATAQVDFYAFVDGELLSTATLSGADGFATGFEGLLPRDARFLTLITSSDGSSGGDWSAFLDPELVLVPPLTLGQVDSFDDGLDGWERGSREVEGADGHLRIPGPEGVYMTTFHHGEQWAGDYPAAGVERVDLSLRNLGPEPLTIHLVFGTTLAPSQGGEWLATATPISVPVGAGWNRYAVPIGPDDLVSVQGAATYESVMTDVRTLRILHNDVPDPRGLIVDSILHIDDVEALPEPGRGPGFGLGAIALGGLARGRGGRRGGRGGGVSGA